MKDGVAIGIPYEEGQEILRKKLAKVRHEKASLLGRLAVLSREEAELVKAIHPREERCQACRGTGKREDEYGEVTCLICSGTGRWKEPV